MFNLQRSMFNVLAALLLMGASCTPTDKKAAPENKENDRPDRQEYTFKYELHIDESDDLVDSISVTGWARGEQADFTCGHELWVKQLPERTDWIVEKDINFDSIPDLMVFRGYVGYGGQGGDVFDAYVWEPERREFVFVDEFNMIPDPKFDAAEKTISTYYRESYECIVSATYKWVDGKLECVESGQEEFEEMVEEE